MSYSHLSAYSDDATSVPTQPIIENKSRSRASRIVKRFMDLGIAVAALLVCWPVLAALCLLIYAQDRKNPIFVQERYGQRGRVFRCFKLRTMVPDADKRLEALLSANPEAAREWQSDHKLRNDPRIMPLGRLLRKTSLDELPQLVNVIKGDMSIVGPRPIVRAEIEKYGICFAYYVQTRPGITGLWQVGGRNDVSYEHRVALDAKYAQEWSVLGDFIILLKTVPAIFSRRGAY